MSVHPEHMLYLHCCQNFCLRRVHHPIVDGGQLKGTPLIIRRKSQSCQSKKRDLGRNHVLYCSSSSDVGDADTIPVPQARRRITRGDESEDSASVRDREQERAKDEVQEKTLRMVETAMLAATTGLAFFLSNNLRIEDDLRWQSYFGFFFPLPAVLAAARWGAPAGLDVTMTAGLLVFLLAGPVKSLTFLFLHGFLGASLGFFWMVGLPWSVSIPLCALVRACGATAFVFLSSWLINENILLLILVNLQTSLTYVFGAISPHLMPSFPFCVTLFYSLLLFNSAAFSFMLHVLFLVFLRRMGFSPVSQPPGWMQRVL